MLDFTPLENFGRRDFLRGIGAAGLIPMVFGKKKAADGLPLDPLHPARTDRFDTLVAIMRTQIDSLFCGRQGDRACEVARDVLTYVSHFPRRFQHGLSVALLWLEFYSFKHTGTGLSKLCPRDVRRVLNQGEHVRRRGDPPLIVWCDDHILHTAVSALAMMGRLVLHSRPAGRDAVNFTWSDKCDDLQHVIGVDPYPLADLDTHYDVCIIGSGAGGATVANRLSAAGYRCIILDTGGFVSPDALIQKRVDENGIEKLAPPRGDQVLYTLYKNGGAQVSGGLAGDHSKLDFLLSHRRKKIRPKQTVNVCQAEVFGGGPYVNNAIHLPMDEHTYATWGDRQPTDLPYETLRSLMDSICGELGVNTEVTTHQVSDRSLRFKAGAEAIGEEVLPLPVAIRRTCFGCGSDNSVDAFGDHVGGVHAFEATGPNSFLVQAMHNPVPAAASYRTRAERICLTRNAAGGIEANGVKVVRTDENGCRHQTTVTADQYVLAAGVGASTQLAARSLHRSGLRNRELGKRLTANIGTAMYALFDQPIWPSSTGQPEPGVTQCFLVDRRDMVQPDGTIKEEPALENWFHFPGTVALALTGWFNDFACAMRKFNHLSMAGIVIPTKVRCQNYVDTCGKFQLEYDRDEFEFLLRGMRRIARIYFAATTPEDGVTLYLPTKAMLLRGGRPLRIRTMDDFEWALCQIRQRGPAFINLLSTHPQGGNAIGSVVDPEGFRLMTDGGELCENVVVADASVFPAGCEINPQLTLKALSTIAAERMIRRMEATDSASSIIREAA